MPITKHCIKQDAVKFADLRSRDQTSSDADALPLAARYLVPEGADFGIVALGQCLDVVVDAGCAGGIDDCIQTGIGVGKADVFQNRGVE